MVWERIAYGRQTPLNVIHGNTVHIVIKYYNEILAPLVAAFVHQHNLTLQQDNARPHVARVGSNYYKYIINIIHVYVA